MRQISVIYGRTACSTVTAAAVAVIVERYETDMREHHANGADILRQRYGARILSVVNGDDIARAVRSGIV